MGRISFGFYPLVCGFSPLLTKVQFVAILITEKTARMSTIELLFIAISLLGLLVSIGLILCLAVMARLNRLNREIKQIYGQENDIKKRIEQYVAKKASDELSKMMLSYREGLDSQSNGIIEAMKEGTGLHLESLKKFILGQEALITKQTEYIVGAIVKKAQDEISTYKQNQLEGIDSQVAQIIDRVAPEVLGKSISLDDHEDLVWKALDRAKREGIFVKGVSEVSRVEKFRFAKSEVSRAEEQRVKKRKSAKSKAKKK